MGFGNYSADTSLLTQWRASEGGGGNIGGREREIAVEFITLIAGSSQINLIYLDSLGASPSSCGAAWFTSKQR